jgi:hypothetical protein
MFFDGFWAAIFATKRNPDKADFIKLEFSHRGGETMIFPRTDMVNSTEEILTDNGIRSPGSPDTLTVWNSKPPQ